MHSITAGSGSRSSSIHYARGRSGLRSISPLDWIVSPGAPLAPLARIHGLNLVESRQHLVVGT